MTRLSILELAAVSEGSSPANALRNARDLAIHAEQWGYHRFWLSEHHNMVGIASAATALVIGYIAEATKSIRIGAGGIMLPNHAPLIIAEQFGTLEALYPGRIDLGVGRAPGSDAHTQNALRRPAGAGENFPSDVQELQALLGPVYPKQVVQAVPGSNSSTPIWILGSGLFGAQLAAALGLPFAFASHFAPHALDEALKIYREQFRPSASLREPYAVVGVNAVVADSDREARHLFTSMQLHFTHLVRNQFGRLPAPIDDIESYWSPDEKAKASSMIACSYVGTPDTVRQGLRQLVARTRADELMAVAPIHDHAARLKSFELLSHLHNDL